MGGSRCHLPRCPALLPSTSTQKLHSHKMKFLLWQELKGRFQGRALPAFKLGTTCAALAGKFLGSVFWARLKSPCSIPNPSLAQLLLRNPSETQMKWFPFLQMLFWMQKKFISLWNLPSFRNQNDRGCSCTTCSTEKWE